MRHIGVNRWSLPPEISIEEAFTLAKSAGFHSVEVNLDASGDLNPESTDADILALKEKALSAGMRVSGVSTGLLWAYPLTDNDPAKREKGIALIRRQIEAAQLLGVNAILVVPGTVTPEVAYDVAYKRSQTALREILPYAQEKKIAIGVENVWNKFLLSPLEFARFLDELNVNFETPVARAYFDVGNILLYGFPEQWIRILGKRIVRIHVKDFKTGIGNMSGFCNPCQGDVPWAKVKTALDEIGYEDAISAEVGGTSTLPELGLKQIAEALKATLL